VLVDLLEKYASTEEGASHNAAALGVTPVILSFARYVKHKYGKNLLPYGKPRRYSAPAYPKSTSSTDLSSKGTSETCPS